jgi:hypothetical protein
MQCHGCENGLTKDDYLVAGITVCEELHELLLIYMAQMT